MSRRADRSAVGVLALMVICTISYFPVAVFTSNWMYMGTDGEHNLWLMSAYQTWAGPSDVTAFNPLQGMTSMLMPVNGSLDLGGLAFADGRYDGVRRALSAAMYFGELLFSCFILARALGFSLAISFVGALWFTVLLLPPTNFAFGIPGYVASAGFYAHALALCNLLVAAFTRIDWRRHEGRRVRIVAYFKSVAPVVAVALLLVLAAPFYNAPLLLGVAAGCAVIVLASGTWTRFVARVLSGAIVLCAFYLLGFADFFLGAGAASHRAPALAATADISFWQRFADNICGAGIACAPSGWAKDAGLPLPYLTGSYWITFLGLAGAVAAIFFAKRDLSRLAASFALAWALFTLWSLLLVLDIIAWPPFLQPFHVAFGLYPLRALFGVYLVAFLSRKAMALVAPSKSVANTGLGFAALVTLGWLGLSAYVATVTPSHRITLNHGLHRPSTPFADILRREVALTPGQKYRGSVATILGVPGGSMRGPLGLTPEEPLPPLKIFQFNALIAESGGQHDFHHMWWQNIPTLSEYGQGISIPMGRYMEDLLSHEDDVAVRNVSIPKKPNIAVLRALGVRFVIIDKQVSDRAARLVETMRLANGIDLYLYELSKPNLGDFAPMRTVAVGSASEFIKAVRAAPEILEEQAFVASGNARGLVPPSEVEIIFEKNAVRVTGNSSGRSAVLLPVQFSHCYSVKSNTRYPVESIRANLMHTLLVFDYALDVSLRWTYKPWDNNDCRVRDAADMKALGL